MEYFYGSEILSKEILEEGLIKIVVLINGSEVEYHVLEEELQNANLAQ